VLQSRSFTSRPWLVAVAGLILTAAVTVPFFFITRFPVQLAIAAGLALAGAIAAGLLARRFARREKDRLTEQHQLHQERADAERKYRDLTDSVPLVTWIYAVGDRNDTRLVSPQIEALLGYAPEQWDGEVLARILHPDDQDRVLEEIAAAGKNGTPFQTEYRVLARNGEVVWLREHARTISKRDGRPLFGESFLVDIGERKRAEDECDRLVAAL
jgi:PAS domain S-box-containing protein